jgi:hypothetical protein
MAAYFKILEDDRKTEYLIFKSKYMCTYTLGSHEDHDSMLKKMTFKDVEPIRYQDIKEIILNESDNELTVTWTFNEEQEREIQVSRDSVSEVKDLLSHKIKGVKIRNYSILKQLIPLFVCIAIVVIFTVVISVIAQEAQNGEDVDVNEVRGSVKRLIINVGILLGPTGTIIIGSLLTALLAFAAYRTYKHPKKGMVVKFSKASELIEIKS